MNISSKTILVTGGAGFVGSYLAELFLKNGFSVRILDAVSRPASITQEIEYMEGDVTKKESWQAALQGISHVLHLAAYGDHYPDFSNCFSVNAAGTALLYEVIRDQKLPIRQVIVASSQSVYGEGKYKCAHRDIFYPDIRLKKDLGAGRWDIRCPKDGTPAEVLPSEEEDKLLPVSPYGISKLAEERIALVAGKEFGVLTTVLRYAMVSGAYQGMRAIYPNALKYFTEQALKKEPIVLHEDGNQSRDLVDIRDLGKAHLLILDNPEAHYRIFNVGSSKSAKISNLAEMVYGVLGEEFKPLFKNEFRPFTPRHLMMSIEKIKKLGWRPTYNLEESVREYVGFAKKYARN